MTEQIYGTEELDSGEVHLPNDTILYWNRLENGNRAYYVDGKLVFYANHPSFVIAAAVAVEEVLSHEEKRIYGCKDC